MIKTSPFDLVIFCEDIYTIGTPFIVLIKSILHGKAEI
jgi:hypothetical protein